MPRQAGQALQGLPSIGGFTVHRPGQDLGAGGLARAPGAGEEIGVGQPAGGYLALQRLGDVLLPHHVVKGAGAVFAVKGLVQSISPRSPHGRAENKNVRRRAWPHTDL